MRLSFSNIIKKAIGIFGFDLIRINQTVVYKDETSKLLIGKDVKIKGNISVTNNSTLIIKDGTTVCSNIVLENHSSLEVGENTKIITSNISLRNYSVMRIGEGCHFDAPQKFSSEINMDEGEFLLGNRSRIQAEVLVRFKGRLSIGDYTGIGFNSEIRCEDQITIGNYGMISYEVCIYDTNTHSVDPLQRRERIIGSYPWGAIELKRPETMPVEIGNDIWIGKGAFISKGVKLNDGCIVGSRTYVSKGTYKEHSRIVTAKSVVL